MNLEDIKRGRKISEEAELNVLKDFGFQLGRVIEQARSIKCKTQTELAKEIGSTQSVIAKIESGNKIPSFDFLNRIAEAFDTYLIPPKFGFMEEVRLVRIVDWNMGDQAMARPKYLANTSVKTYEI